MFNLPATITPQTTLGKRILSAALIAPLFLLALYIGDWMLAIWLIIAFGISVYEWYFLARKNTFFIPVLILGVIYMSLSYGSFLALREVYSLNIIILFMGMIWSSDIGAYFAGKTIGGAKLLPSISPNKTWSGFGGALFSPALFAVIWVYFMGLGVQFTDINPFFLPFIAITFGIITGSVGQAGDLLISFLKRQAGVKDTGHLIPGHGGLLDRIDSMLLATPIFFISLTLLSYI